MDFTTAPPQFFQVAATVIPLLLITVALTQAPMVPDDSRDKALLLITRLTALTMALLGLAGSLAALRFGSNRFRLDLTTLGLAIGFVFAGNGLAVKTLRDAHLERDAERAVLRAVRVLVALVLAASLTILTGGSSRDLVRIRLGSVVVGWTTAGVVVAIALAAASAGRLSCGPREDAECREGGPRPRRAR